MFGILPAYAFYIRHAKDLQLSDIRITIRQEDARPAFVLDDVHDSAFLDVRAESISSTPSFHLEENCTNNQIAPAP